MDPFIGQIMAVGFTYAPQGWSTCAGQIIPISQNNALFALLGTTYGGNGSQTFALPNLGGRMVVGAGQSAGTSAYVPGQIAGAESVALTQSQLPLHTHAATFAGTGSNFQVSSTVQASDNGPTPNAVLARSIDLNPDGTAIPAIYAPAGSAVDTALGGLNVAGTVSVSPVGGTTPVSVLSPYLALTMIIATQGIFPPRP